MVKGGSTRDAFTQKVALSVPPAYFSHLLLSNPPLLSSALHAVSKASLDFSVGTGRDFRLACSGALATAGIWRLLLDRYYLPHFAVAVRFQIDKWISQVAAARKFQPDGALLLAYWGWRPSPSLCNIACCSSL